MKLSISIDINKPTEQVWNAIVDFENCQKYIESITNLEILEKPADTLVGFKWKETRLMFGKEATETMWITDVKENSFYQTRAESHGSIYISKFIVEPNSTGTTLTMDFTSTPQSFGAKIFTLCLGFMFKGPMKKAMMKDLADIKKHLESS